MNLDIKKYTFQLSWVVWIFTASIFIFSLVLPGGDSYGVLGLLFVSPVLFFLNKTLPHDSSDYKLCNAFLIYGVGMILIFSLHDFNTRDFDKPSRFLLAIPVIFLLLRLECKKTFLIYSIMLGAFLSFLVAVYEKFYLNLARASGFENQIMFGNISLLLGVLCASFSLYFYSKRMIPHLILALSFSFCGLFSSALSGSRGGWIALPVVAIYLIWCSRNLLGKKVILSVLSFFVLASLIIATLPSLGVSKRLNRVVTDVSQYVDGSNIYTPVGTRFELWKGSLYLFLESPFFGVGKSRQMEVKQMLIEKGLLHKWVNNYNHAHNEYLNELSLHGITGLLLLLFIYLIPIRLFYLKIKKYPENWSIKTFAISGTLVPICYMLFSLTQSMFSHSFGVMMYVFPIGILWAATRWAIHEEKTLRNIN